MSENSRIQELGVQRRMVAWKTTQAWQQIPHVAFQYEPDVTDFFAAFGKLKNSYRQQGPALSLNTVLLKTVALALQAAPQLNSALRFDPRENSGTLETFSSVNIDVPWLLPDGKMISLTAFGVERKSLREIAADMEALRARVERTDFDMLLRAIATGQIQNIPADWVQPDQVAAGTVTVSNLGSICRTSGSVALLEILPPQVLAVGVSALQEKPGVFVNAEGRKEIGIRKTLPLCLAFDHRAFDFGDVVPMIQRLDELFAAPQALADW